MSIQFSDTSTYKGLVQLFEAEIGAGVGDVANNSNRLKRFTADVNVTWDDYLNLVLPIDGGWQFDDTNHTDAPVRTMTLTSGTRRYALHSFTADAGANLMLGIDRVFVKNPSGVYYELQRVDKQNDDFVESFNDGQDTQGAPYRYDVTGFHLDLDPVPNYTIAAGIKVLLSREASYFTSTDTTKKPGCTGTHHHYFYLKPALFYAQRHSLPNRVDLERRVMRLEQDIIETYKQRNGRAIMTGKKVQFI